MRYLIISLFTVATLLMSSSSSISSSSTSEAASHVDTSHPQAQDRGEFQVFLPFVGNGHKATRDPANPNASADARKVLNYLAHLPDRQDNRVISGQSLRSSIGLAGAGYREFVVDLHAVTDKWVGMIGLDYGWDPSPSEISTGNQVLIDYWNSEGLITLSHHANNPWTGGNCRDLRHRDFTELIHPTTEFNRQAHARWMAELDKVAAGLAELREAGVVVLWRPFHEMTYTNTFWWGVQRNDPVSNESYKNMWRHMFNYFTYDKGLNNLLWVYAAADTDSYNSVDGPYPGDEYVDVVAIDVYSDSMTIIGRGYNKLVALGKPFALTEVGPEHRRDGSFDNMITINAIRNRYPQTTYFLYWHSWTGNRVSIVDNRNARALLNDPWVITRDEIDWRSEPVTPAPDQLIVDNTHPRFSTTSSQDAWQEWIQAGGEHYGGSHHYNGQIGSGQDTATWSFTVPKPGNYDVYAWWWWGDYRPPDVPYTVNHSGDSTTVRVDQRVNGGRWNLLGTFHFQDEGWVRVSDDVSSGRDVVADAVRLVYSSAGPVPTATPTLAPTSTPTPTATHTPLPTDTPNPTGTSTPLPTATPTLAPTSTPTPTVTDTPLPTNTPNPTATSTPPPTDRPTSVPTVTPTLTPTSTPTFAPTNTPVPTNTPGSSGATVIDHRHVDAGELSRNELNAAQRRMTG